MSHEHREIFGTSNHSNYQSLILLVLCEGNPPMTGGFPSERASNVESVSMTQWHHDYTSQDKDLFFILRRNKQLSSCNNNELIWLYRDLNDRGLHGWIETILMIYANHGFFFKFVPISHANYHVYCGTTPTELDWVDAGLDISKNFHWPNFQTVAFFQHILYIILNKTVRIHVPD